MPSWWTDKDLFSLMKNELFVAVVGDVLDQMGYKYQFLPPQIHPLLDDMVVVGRAMPVLATDIPSAAAHSKGTGVPFGRMFEALDDLKENEVYLSTGSSPTYALWGENMSTRAIQLGAAGAVVNGYSRDTRGICRVQFPTFSWGGYAQDQKYRGEVVDFRCTIAFPNKVTVQPGDIVFGDLDGVIILPQKVERETVETALERVRGESLVHEALLEGKSAQEAFKQYGIM